MLFSPFRSSLCRLAMRISAVFLALASLLLSSTVVAQTDAPRVSSVPSAPMAVHPAVNYESMPAAVQQKMNENKAAGLPYHNGIVKKYTVDIAAVTSTSGLVLLDFLSSVSGFIRSEFISPGHVMLIVEPALESTALKNALLGKSVSFQFIDETYTVSE